MDTHPLLTKQDIADRLDRLAISADAKAVLQQIAVTTAKVGTEVILIGRQVLSFILDMFRQFPNTTLGAIAGFVVATLVASVPFVGAVLGAFLGPLLMAFGIAVGAATDIANSPLRTKLEVFEAHLKAMEASRS